MAYLWRAALAVIGLLLVRGFVYPRGWGRPRPVHLLVAALGALLTVPLIRMGWMGATTAVGAALVLLFPYRSLAATYLRRRVHAGLRRLASEWDTRLREDPDSGLCEVVREDAEPALRVANVLIRTRSIHPRVRKTRVDYMLAFVAELQRRPPFHCSLMVGWEDPRYFEREWRSVQVVQGDHLAVPLAEAGAAETAGRATGAQIRELRPHDGLDPGPPHGLRVLVSDPPAFERVFRDELLRRFRAVAGQTYPFELNVTPVSANIYTTYCDLEAQRSNLSFLELLVARLSECEPGRRST